MTGLLSLSRRGFSLIELLVSMAIGLVLTLAITTVLIHSESDKRSTTAVNDTNQSGAYAAYVLDRVIRSAGSGYSQRWREMYGCPLVAYKGGTKLTFQPPAGATSTYWPNPGKVLTLAPVLIGKDQADKGTTDKRGDLITVMAGTAGYSETPQAVVSTLSGASPQINVTSVLGYQADDLVLLADQTVTAGCMVQQLGTPTSGGALPLAGAYTTSSGLAGSNTVSVSSFGTGSYVAQLGSAKTTNNNAPEFITFGVTDNHVLSAFDLLEINGSTPSEIGEGVVEMHALYGIDVINGHTGKVDKWVDPGEAPYDIDTLLGANQQTALRNIIAIRVGLILRTSLPEQQPVAQPQNLTLFSDLGALKRIRTLDPSEVNYRFRTIEMTVPLRNVVITQ